MDAEFDRTWADDLDARAGTMFQIAEHMRNEMLRQAYPTLDDWAAHLEESATHMAGIASYRRARGMA